MPCTYIWYVLILVRDSMLTHEKKNGGSMPLATMPCFSSINSGSEEISFQIQSENALPNQPRVTIKNPPTAAESKE